MEGMESIDRRTALKVLVGGVAALSLAACGYYDNQTTKVEINEDDYFLLKEKNYNKTPQNFNGQFYDISSNKYISDSNSGIILPKENFFPNERTLFHWRDTKATPEMLQNNPVFQQIVQRTEILMDQSSKALGNMYKDFVLPQAVATAVRRTLKYDTTKARLGAISPFDFRLKMGLTDCQEFTATVAYVLAHFGKPSAVAMHTYLDPNGSGKRLDHLYNAIDIEGSSWIIDSTASDKLFTFQDFLTYQEEIKNTPEGGIIKYDSVFPNQNLPWEDPKWTATQSSQNKTAPNTVAFAMDKVQI